MRIKRLAIIASLMLGSASVASALDAADAFTQAPQQIFPLLDTNSRLDMVDYVRSGLDTPSANLLAGKSVITDLSPASLTVRLSDASTAQLFILQAGGKDVIALISTLATPGLDSTLAFYDAEWQPLDATRYFTKPGWIDWLATGGSLADVKAVSPFMLASYDYDPATSTLTATNNLGRFLDPDLYETISSELRPTIVYTWTGGKFTKK